jgi:putative membrane protein
MIASAALSFLHFTLILVVAGALSAEAVLLRLKADAATLKLLARMDGLYGTAAGLLIAAGIGRVFWGGGDPSFYLSSHAFWGKMAVFLVIGLLSIRPTLKFIGWARAARADETFVAPEKDVRAVRVMVMIEVHLLALVILFAVLMARGVG